MKQKIIYIKTTENCNLYCEHCFVPRVEKKMKFENIIKIVKHLNSSFKKNTEIQIIWHGGEPTLIGYEWLEKAILYINNNINNNITINHNIQTNLINYNDKWKELYKKYFKSYIGISYDFNIRYFKNSNEEFEKNFWKNVEKLKIDKIDFNVIVTITKHVLDMGAVKFFEWIKNNKIKSIHLERLSKTGYAIDNWKKIGFNNKEYNDFMINFTKLYIPYITNSDNEFIHISPLNALIKNIKKNVRTSCAGSCSNFFTFNPDGSIKGCTSLDNKLGNINDDFKDIITKNLLTKRMCIDCEFQQVCGSGCPTTPIYDETGECIGNYRLLKLLNILNIEKINKLSLSNDKIFNSW